MQREIYLTKPILSDSDSKVAVLTLLGHSDVTNYLYAIKSFVNHVQARLKIFVLDDGTLTKEDKRTLGLHILAFQWVSAPPQRFRSGCWDRLYAVKELLKDNYYVIQLDSDTVTLNDLIEIDTCIRNQTNFGLATRSEDRKVYDIGNILYKNNAFAQSLFEKNARPKNMWKQYVKVNGGLCGFSTKTYIPYNLDEVAIYIASFIGEIRLEEWGTEQIACCLILATTDVSVLDTDQYKIAPNLKHLVVSFAHFISGYRGEDYSLAKQVALNTLDKYTFKEIIQIESSLIKGSINSHDNWFSKKLRNHKSRVLNRLGKLL